MKHIITLPVAALVAAVAFTACSGNDKNTGRVAQDDALIATQNELRETIASQDSLLAIMNAISDDMARLKEVEGIMNSPNFTDKSPEHQAQVIDDIAAIQNELESRRARLNDLEQRLKASKADNTNLHKAIATLKAQINEQEITINNLKNSLAQANMEIENLNSDIRGLHQRIDSVSYAKEEVENQLNNELNTVYYALGNKSELKEHKLIETGFLRKTKVLPGDFEEAYFTPADKRTLSQLPLLAKKVKVITNQPQDSYTITEDEHGLKVLNITDPQRFWAVSNFLVIQTN